MNTIKLELYISASNGHKKFACDREEKLKYRGLQNASVLSQARDQ